MAPTQLMVETVPAAVVVEEREGGRRLLFSFVLHNYGPDELELIGIQQDVYDEGGGLVRRRLVDESGSPFRPRAAERRRIGSGEHLTLPNPLAEFAAGTSLTELIYTFAFRTPAGVLVNAEIRVTPTAATTSAAAAPQPRLDPSGGNEDQAAPPTPRQLVRAWFETLYGLGVYATA